VGSKPTVVVFDYGSGNVHSAVKALERGGAEVSLTAERQSVMDADGLVVPRGRGFSDCYGGSSVQTW